MNLTVTRRIFTSRSTIGDLFVDGRFQCHTLEPAVRPVKIPGVTAIPAGIYQVIITRSERFQRDLPLLVDVPQFEGVRIHPGNTPEDTAGCLLVGKTTAADFVGNSRDAFAELFATLTEELSKGDKISIEIIDAGVSPLVASQAESGHIFQVTADPLRLRSSPTSAVSNNIIGRLPFGLVVTRVDRQAPVGWLEIDAMIEGRLQRGFAASAYLEPLPIPAPGPACSQPAELFASLYRVNSETLNLRSQPAVLTPDTILASLPRKQLVRKIANSAKAIWWQVAALVHGKLIEGFVNSAFLVPARLAPPVADPLAVSQSGEMQLSERAVQLILDFEGLDQPSCWPGQQSGISLGRGYDLGYHSHDEFMGDWGPHLTTEQLTRLAKALGKRGPAAAKLAPAFSDIKIKRAAADAVFCSRTVPKIKVWALRSFPGMLALPRDAQGALASLVFNRGTDMQGDRRREMREIRDVIAAGSMSVAVKLTRIAAALRAMKRLWPSADRSSGHPGIRRRREAEAVLVERAG